MMNEEMKKNIASQASWYTAFHDDDAIERIYNDVLHDVIMNILNKGKDLGLSVDEEIKFANTLMKMRA